MRGVREVVKNCYGLPGPDPRGLENDNGAHGDFTFDVAERSITLDYNERFTASTFHQHTFLRWLPSPTWMPEQISSSDGVSFLAASAR